VLGSSILRGLSLGAAGLGLLALGGAVAVLIPACVRSTARSSDGTSQEWAELKQEIRHRFPRAPQISTEELAERLGGSGEGRAEEEAPRPLLLDARTPREYAVSHLPGAVSTPDVESALDAIRTAGGQRPVIVYCSVGWRSSDLVQKLRDRGVERVWNLEGSIFQWANEGRPVVRNGNVVRQVHPYDESWGRFLERDLWAFEPGPGAGTETDGAPP
jgi:rhodanese-related sulfurtransferase